MELEYSNFLLNQLHFFQTYVRMSVISLVSSDLALI